MAATRFLPGVLSFLYALSHLEGVAHRPTSYTHSPVLRSLNNPTGKTDTGSIATSSTITEWSHGHSFGTGNAHTGFLRARHSLLKSQGRSNFLYRNQVGRTIQAPYVFRPSGRMEEEPFSRLTLAVYSHASGLTLVTHGTACVPPARITLVHPLLPKLRIKHKCTCLFEIILKYYSQA
jgi:hypothetical protein